MKTVAAKLSFLLLSWSQQRYFIMPFLVGFALK